MKCSNIIAVVEARMTSSRLPGKHLLQANGKPMLQHLVDRLKRVSLLNDIVIATTTNSADDELVNFAKSNNIAFYRGSELDVMGRVVEAGKYFGADVICEVTGDCPIIDPSLVEHAVQTFVANDAVYVNYGVCAGLPDGMGCQVFLWNALNESAKMTRDSLDREHVTLHIKNHPESFRSIYMVAPSSLYRPNLSVTLDESSDYILIKKIIENFGDANPFFSCDQVISILEENSDWVKINQHVQRKGEG